ncbi:unnamed protein product [Sphagnum jensenii]|uniref:Uncharacterized protein n=1 Tax=Sphagnum jensenii TaxID=128206 RepID=A0ABP0VXD5_9BRYO
MDSRLQSSRRKWRWVCFSRRNRSKAESSITLDMGKEEEGSLQPEAAAETQEIMSPRIGAAAARRLHIHIGL